jgi:hypothetical protein
VCVAAKYGNTEVARCLCLAGARIDAKNREGVVAEVCARVQGHASFGTPFLTPPPPPQPLFFYCSSKSHVFYICATFLNPHTLLYRPFSRLLAFFPSLKEFKGSVSRDEYDPEKQDQKAFYVLYILE